MTRGINKMFGCPKIVKFEYDSNDNSHKAIMEFSTPFEAQRVLKSTFCYYRGKPLTIELGSQLSSERLHSLRNPNTPSGTSRRDQDSTARDKIDRRPGQARRVSCDSDGKISRSSAILISAHTNKRVIESHVKKGKDKEDVKEPEETNLNNFRGEIGGNKSLKSVDNNKLEMFKSPSIESRRASIGRIEDQKRDQNPKECMGDNRLPKERSPPVPLLNPSPDHVLSTPLSNPSPDHVLSLPPSVGHPDNGENSERDTVGDGRHAEQDNNVENKIDEMKQCYQRARKEIQERKDSFALLSLDFKQEQDAKIEAQNALADAKARLADLSSRNFYIEKRHDEFQRDHESMRIEYEEKQNDLTNQNTELQSMKNAIALKLDRKNNALEKAMAEIKSLRAEKDPLVESHSQLANDLKKQSNLIESQIENIIALEREKTNLKLQIDVLTKENQVYKERLDDTTIKLEVSLKKGATEKDKFERIQKWMEKKHKSELEQARRSTDARSDASATSDAASTTRLKEELESKNKEHNELQQNFNTIAMQNFKQSNTIEEQRAEIRRLKNQLRRNTDDSIILKIED